MSESFPELKTPEAKKIARSIAEEAWASKMLTVSDPVLRRLGSVLVLQELKERMAISDDAPDTLRSPPPTFDVVLSGRELMCKGCELTKPEDDFYKATSSRTGRRSLCRPCFNRKYKHKKYTPSKNMDKNDLHPTDDQSEPGAFSTLGSLHHEIEYYMTKRNAVRAAEDAVKFAEQALISARLELTWAKRNLTEAIEKAQLVTTADALNKERLTEAPSIEIPLPPKS